MKHYTKIIGACCKAGQKKIGPELSPHEIFKSLRKPSNFSFIDNFIDAF